MRYLPGQSVRPEDSESRDNVMKNVSKGAFEYVNKM
jgi:hypothetical protein